MLVTVLSSFGIGDSSSLFLRRSIVGLPALSGIELDVMSSTYDVGSLPWFRRRGAARIEAGG